MKPFLSVIIPAYHEAERLPLTLVDVDRILAARDYSAEVLVIIDGGTDGTTAVANRLATSMPEVRVIENAENHGKGWVVRQGMLAARGNWRLFMDADNSTSLAEFDRMLPFLSAGGGSAYGGKKKTYDVVIGSRAVPGAKLDPPQAWYRRLLGKLGNRLIQWLAVPGIHDTQCGFKCLSEEAAIKIFSVATIDRWGFDVEMLALARQFGFSVMEMPVTWVNDTRSTVPASAYLSTLRDVWRVRQNIKRGTYRIDPVAPRPSGSSAAGPSMSRPLPTPRSSWRASCSRSAGARTRARSASSPGCTATSNGTRCSR